MGGPGAGLVVREAGVGDAGAMAALLNGVIARGGTTAHETAFTAERIEREYLTAPAALCCFVAVDGGSGEIAGFQVLGRYADAPGEIGDIGTFARVGGTQRGVGSALFAATLVRARALGLAWINATIRGDNAGGLAFYTKLGFADHSVLVGVPLKDGRRVDRVVKRFPVEG